MTKIATKVLPISMSKLKKQLEIFYRLRKPVVVWGPPGIGKSQGIAQMREVFAKMEGVPVEEFGFIDYRAALRDAVDIHGIPAADLKTKSAYWLPAGDLPQERRDGKFGILFLDEISLAPPAVQSALYGLVLDRKVGEYRLPENWWVVAAGNRVSDRSGAFRMSRALASRFSHFELAVDATGWIRNYAIHHCHDFVVQYIQYKPENLYIDPEDFGEGSDERITINPRNWSGIGDICDLGVRGDDLKNAVAASIGEELACEFVGVTEVWDDLPDLDDCIANPTTADVPDVTKPSYMFALSTGLARAATPKNFGKVMTYAQRLGKEYEITTCLNATELKNVLINTKAYQEFMIRHKDINVGKFNVG